MGEPLLAAELWALAWALLSSQAGRRGHAGSVASASTRHLDCTAKPTLVFLPGESYGQKSLVDYSPWGLQRIDTAERLTLSRSLPRLDKPYVSVYRF